MLSFNSSVSNLYQVVVNNADKYPSKIAIFDEEQKISNLQLKAYIDSIASFLAQNEIQSNDKVALMMGNSWQFIASFFAVSKIGAIVIPVNSFFKADEVAYVLNDSQAKLLITSGKFTEQCRDMLIKSNVQKIIWTDNPPIENDENINFNKLIAAQKNSAPFEQRNINDLAAIIYTSGTTGKPKGAMLSFKNLLSNVNACLAQLKLGYNQARMVCYLPMFHAFTLTVTVLLPIVSNSGVVVIRSIANKRDFANLLKQVLLKRVRYFAGIPDVYSALARAKLPWYFHWFHNVRGFISGAAPLSNEVMHKFAASFKRGTLIQGYGISECSPVVSVNRPDDNRIGSVGQPLPSYEVAIFDENMQALPVGGIGEICIKGDCVMQGYYNRPEETAETIVNGWFKTGDIGRIDKENFIYILDRKKDLIINKGMNIYPREIEEVLYTNPKVNACAVIGLKDEDANEIPIAYIELKENEVATEAELKEFIKPHLALFKQPRKIIFIDKLPRNSTGKILKRALRDSITKG